MENKREYTIRVKCKNCGFNGTLKDIPAGVPVEDTECPVCGVKSLEANYYV